MTYTTFIQFLFFAMMGLNFLLSVKYAFTRFFLNPDLNMRSHCEVMAIITAVCAGAFLFLALGFPKIMEAC